MKKLIDKLINVDKKVLIFLIIICIIGIITGSFFMTVLSNNDKESIMVSLEEFMSFSSSNKETFINDLTINLIFMLIMWLLGASVVGVPIVIIMLFIKSFLISFTISSFIMKYKFKGIVYGIVYNLPHQIINLVVFMYLGVYAIKLSSFIIDTVIHKKTLNFKNITNRYLLVLGITIIFLIISSLYSSYIMPTLLKKVVSSI